MGVTGDPILPSTPPGPPKRPPLRSAVRGSKALEGISAESGAQGAEQPPALSHPIPSDPILSYLILSYPNPTCSIPSCITRGMQPAVAPS